MKSNLFLLICLSVLATGTAQAQWPMSNDPDVVLTIESPAYEPSAGPLILLDGAHHNFFIQWDFINPFATLAAIDGYICWP